ncbi:MAG: hypothetical protein Q8S54_17100 [Bacteroidota bacterium]|nr:hypothetical protein [Odoribacter sp.]MDP3644887.1 hypothetical protein [Bacteroidota bacterium]
MSKFSTLDYLINSYQAGKKEIEFFQFSDGNYESYNLDFDQIEFEPSQSSIDAILDFASQYEVLQSHKTGNIELNLN